MVNIKWKSQDEIDYEKFLDSLKPSQEEVEKAKMELVILNLLIEMEMM